ncbi:peptidase S74 [Corallococcus sp. AB030]|uniref:tail fiber domain-containing protein n=1 Tax=Corallococcus TaxID=83461 RepID=UPI000ED72F03|nr:MULTISPECIES: tail fiber domain-containing protein [Corallococcus]NRD56156.1 tail fiber domain-containing protein [Corallococcus exiguus]RKI18987.1 peptidase S74 [Corallococcus sp. AB030]RUO94544.1 peptidase S74 [Corallococcus sp. AB018]
MASVRGVSVALGCVVGLVTSACGSDPAPGQQREIGTGLTLEGDAVRVVYGDGPGTAVEGNDPRLSAAGQGIRNGTAPQDASFAVAGTGQVRGRLTANADVVLDASASAKTPVPLLSVSNTVSGTGEPTWERQGVFTVDSAGGLMARGEFGMGTIPAQGKGTRMMWYPAKGAFRAGSTETQWDDANVGQYSWAGGNNNLASAYGSFSFGDQCTASGTVSVCMGSANTASGTASFSAGASNIASGFTSVAVGYTNTATGQGSVALGYRNSANGDYSTALGQRASSGGFTGSFIWADQSTSSSVVTNTANNQFMARASGGFRFRTSSNLTTGCDLPAGSGVFTCTSDRTTKEDFRRVDAEAVLAKVAAMPVESWRYSAEAGGVRHLGPVAQDFRAAFGLGTDDKSIGLLDIDGVNMVAIQALARRTEELHAKSAEVDTLKAQMAELQRSLSRLEAAVHAKGAKP